MNNKLESWSLGEILTTARYADDITLMAESDKELKNHLMRMKVESEKAGLKLNIKKTKIIASGSITSRQIDGETMETVIDYFGGLQNHWGLKVKDACSFEGKLWQS